MYDSLQEKLVVCIEIPDCRQFFNLKKAILTFLANIIVIQDILKASVKNYILIAFTVVFSTITETRIKNTF